MWGTMSVTATVERLLDMGYRPSEIVRMGYAKSTVYTVYKRWLRKRLGENVLYVAYDVDFGVLEKLVGQLKLLGYSVVVGGTTEDTLDIVSIASLVVVVVGRAPGYRRQLLYRELEEAVKHGKQVVALVEEGSALHIGLPRDSIAIYFSRDNISKTVNNVIRVLRTKKEGQVAPILISIAIGLLIALGIATLAEMFRLLLEKT